jgi:hypothetical protein
MSEMSELMTFLKKLPPCGLGEALRAITFVGDGFGCYSDFNVRTDATPWSREQIKSFVGDNDDSDFIVKAAEGYTFQEGGVTIDAFWYWDGDGTLQFRVKEGGKVIREVTNTDCKQDCGWEEIEHPAESV